MISHTPAAGLDASDGTPGPRRISAVGIAITDPKIPAGIGD
jgi:hypothetical protein